MKRGLLVFLAICAFTAAMVPRNRRAVNSEEQQDSLRHTDNSTAETTTKKETERLLCEPQTPCAWSIYKMNTINIIEMNITNIYCECSPGTECQIHQEEGNALVHRCKTLDVKQRARAEPDIES